MAVWPRQVAGQIGHAEDLAHLIQAGADSILVPSRSEPCGLTQIYALAYGSPPLVRRTGGLADTVVNAEPDAVAAGTATGFVFDDPTAAALGGTLAWAIDLFPRPATPGTACSRPAWPGTSAGRNRRGEVPHPVRGGAGGGKGGGARPTAGRPSGHARAPSTKVPAFAGMTLSH